ncbi:DUF2567 domain-containing protein [Catellatospora sp. TT07R-123]|uniref:DUF2567 domain-containing protein n=1 Tax=Catellatospora sp. TT07R-123 TaxID=2733863 RepID=UPI001BB30C6C|nr:DUF2567 domain-containing protein [Catellatospora sp. TT07R-123]
MLSDDTSSYEVPLQVEPRPRPPVGAEVGSAVVAALVVGVLGLALGWAWHLLAPTLPLKVVQDGAVYTSNEPEQLAAADGWFVLLGFGFGLLAALLAWVLLPRRRGPWQLAGVVVGCLIAGWAAWWLGHSIGLAHYQDLLAHAPVDTMINKPVDLRAVKHLDVFPWAIGGSLLVPALGAVIMYAMLAAWSRWPSLRRNEEPTELYDDEPDFDPQPGFQQQPGLDRQPGHDPQSGFDPQRGHDQQPPRQEA